MAKTSLVVKAGRKQRYQTREYNRCARCGRPRATTASSGSAASACAKSRTRASSPV